jgi:hypothetical protein
MTMQTPTRITIEVHQPDRGDVSSAQAPIVHVFSEAPTAPRPAMASVPREAQPAPAVFDPGECRCLDADDCNADHAND